MNEAEINDTIKKYVLDEFLPGEDPAALTDTVPLIGTGILDSIAVLKLVTFLEAAVWHQDRSIRNWLRKPEHVADITRLVKSKLA